MKLKNQFLRLFALLGLSMAATSAWAAEVQFSTDGGTVSIPQSGAVDNVSLADNVTSFKVYNFGGEQTISANTTGAIVLVASNDCIFRVSGSISRAAPNGTTYSVRPSVTIFDGSTAAATQLINVPSMSDNGEELTFKPRLTTGNSLRILLRGYTPSTSSGSSIGLDLTIQVLKKNSATAAIDIYRQGDNGYGVAKINGDYAGSDEVSISTAIKVDSIVYNRTFTAGTPSTIVLPFSLPNTATTNAKFYYLKQVVKVDNECKWKATFRNITLDNANALPAANTPYAVIVPNATKLQFYLNGGQATFLTDDIAEQYDNTKKWIFKGTYQYKTWESNDPELGLAYALAAANDPDGAYTAGQYVKVGAGSYAIPMRAYIRKVDAYVTLQSVANGRPLAQSEISSIENLPETIDAEFIDEDEKTTAIGRMNTVTGAIKIDRWFDLKGRSTNHKPTTKGAFFNKKGIAK